MATFKVVFEIEIEAESPFEGARTVQDWLLHNNWQFYVQDDKGNVHSVDLQENDEDAVLPVDKYEPLITQDTISIDDAIKLIKGLTKPNCDDHTPYCGTCVTCGEWSNDDVLDPEEVLAKLNELKK